MNTHTKPNCVGFIMDGNRRFARAKGEGSYEGHKQGEQIFVDAISWVQESGIEHAVFYAFSTENWNRSKEEVRYLMELFEVFLHRILKTVSKQDLKVRIIGRRTDFSLQLQTLLEKVETTGSKEPRCTIWVALSYGGRAEVVAAVNEAVKNGTEVEEASFSELLWSAGMPDPDLIIRTGGEKRLSNFLPWQSVYSELFFTDTYWPAFTKEEFLRIVEEYGTRKRRHGV